uniref:Uncharacterized protein n=1 Tax=Eptatretus burgeri TaxID=7764 RepID=A0A8C4WVE1_EPTBU
MKFCGLVRCVTRTNSLDFGANDRDAHYNDRDGHHRASNSSQGVPSDPHQKPTCVGDSEEPPVSAQIIVGSVDNKSGPALPLLTGNRFADSSTLQPVLHFDPQNSCRDSHYGHPGLIQAIHPSIPLDHEGQYIFETPHWHSLQPRHHMLIGTSSFPDISVIRFTPHCANVPLEMAALAPMQPLLNPYFEHYFHYPMLSPFPAVQAFSPPEGTLTASPTEYYQHLAMIAAHHTPCAELLHPLAFGTTKPVPASSLNLLQPVEATCVPSPRTLLRRSRKRTLPVPPISDVGLDVQTMLHTSPNSLIAFINSSLSSSSASSYCQLSAGAISSFNPPPATSPVMAEVQHHPSEPQHAVLRASAFVPPSVLHMSSSLHPQSSTHGGLPNKSWVLPTSIQQSDNISEPSVSRSTDVHTKCSKVKEETKCNHGYLHR